MSSTGDEYSEAGPSSPPEFNNSRKLRARTTEAGESDALTSYDLENASQGHPSVDDNSDLEDNDANRSNRFLGPASAWHAYTQEERGLAASLDQSRANDLGIHLYNAHSLKARLRTLEHQEPWRSKSSWIQADENGKQPWQPDQHWTAWPMPPEQVPRKEETFGAPVLQTNSGETYRKDIPWTPSAVLQDELQAVVLRKATSRFRRRQWTNVDRSEHGTETPSNPETLPDHESTVDSIKSQQIDFAGTALSSEHHWTPTITADDEEASAILEPTARHVLTKLDDLLLALHKSRSASRPKRSTSRSRSRPTQSQSPSSSKTRQPHSVTSRNPKRRRLGTESDAEDDVGEATRSITNAPDAKRPSGHSEHVLGLRDWSEVLGMAALTGWDSTVIDNAARRCASLFGEGMSFRTMPETPAWSNADRRVEYAPGIVSPIESDMEESGEDIYPEPTAVPGYFCPFADCERRRKPFPAAFRWREHLVRKHKLSKAQIEEHERRIPGSRAASQVRNVKQETLSHEETEEGNVIGNPQLFNSHVAVHGDGFLDPVTAPLGRGKGMKQRREQSQKMSDSE